jgi:hypothetical protein
MIWLSVNRDFFTGISSTQITRKFHFWLQLNSGGITPAPDVGATIPLLTAGLGSAVAITAFSRGPD